MSQILHIFRKDLRRLRWWLAAWTGLLAARVLLATAGAHMAAEGVVEELVVEQVTGAIGIAGFVMFALLVARLVQDEPLVGLDWFWLTRPYDRWSLLGAKLVFAVLFFVLLPVIAQIVVMAAFDAGPTDMVRASSVFLARDLRWTFGLMVFAVLTPSLVAFALGLIGTAAIASLLLLGTFAVAMLRFEEETPPSSSMQDHVTWAIVATLVFLVAALAVITYQYRRRRPVRAIALAAIGVAAVAIVPAIWPWSFASSRSVEAPPWEGEVTVGIDRTVPPRIHDQPAFRRRSDSKRVIHVPVNLSGFPPDYRAQQAFARSRLELPDGQVLQSGQSSGIAMASMAISSDAAPVNPLQGALGDVRVLPLRPAMEPDSQPTTALLSVTEDELARYGSQPGRLTTTLQVPLQRSRLIGAIPFVEHASLERDGLRTEIVRIRRRHDGCSILIRRWQVTSMLSIPDYRQREYVLRNLAQREAFAGTAEHRGVAASGISPLLLFGLTRQAGREGFAVEHLWIDYPERWRGEAGRWVIDPQWLDGADLAVVETAPAGTITRTITLEDFRMQDVPQTP